MDAAVLIPGIMGTRLLLPATAPGVDPEEVWPPTPLETQTGYKRIDKLLDRRVVAGDVSQRGLALLHSASRIGLAKQGMVTRLMRIGVE